MSLRVVPISLEEANAFVAKHHRHHSPVVGHKFSVAVAANLIDSEPLLVCGVAVVSRPVSRVLDDGWTLEITRCCTDGSANACSMLYRTCWRAARAIGYTTLITYTIPEEGGASLRGAGFKVVGERGGGSWSRSNRPRVDTHPLQTKLLWEVCA